MNLSLTFLTLTEISGSHLFIIPRSFVFNRFEMHICSFMKFENAIINADSGSRLTVRDTSFRYGLLRAVHVTSAMKRFGELKTAKVFIRCDFANLKGETGGAIASKAPVTVISCVFTKCTADSGGAIATVEALTSNSSTYCEVSSSNEFGLFAVSNDGDFLLDSNSFYVSRSQRASFRKFGRSAVSICDNNFTRLEGVTLPGFEIGQGSPRVSYCTFERLTAEYGMCVFSLWQSVDFTVTATFVKLCVNRTGPTTSFIAWLDGSKQTGSFIGCSVVETFPSQGALLYCQDSMHIHIEECCFCVKRDLVANNAKSFDFGHGNMFERSACPYMQIEMKSSLPEHVLSRGIDMTTAFILIGSFGAISFMWMFIRAVRIGSLS